MHAKDLLSLDDFTPEEVRQLLDLTAEVKREPGRFSSALAGQTLAMLFQKPSTRTRVSFHVGMVQLGGVGLVLNQNELQLGRGESVADTAAVLSRYVNGIMARVFEHADVEDLANHASVPVINGLSDLLHPCQALCDYFTLTECFGTLKGLRVAYIGDGNNMVHSLANGAAKLGVALTIATPRGYEPRPEVIQRAQQQAAQTGGSIDVVRDPRRAVIGANAIYTDVWTSMGQEAEKEARLQDFRGFQIDAGLMALADPDAIFLHCLPAHRGEEVAAEVIDGPQSRVFDQAENRLHAQKAILISLMA